MTTYYLEHLKLKKIEELAWPNNRLYSNNGCIPLTVEFLKDLEKGFLIAMISILLSMMLSTEDIF